LGQSRPKEIASLGSTASCERAGTTGRSGSPRSAFTLYKTLLGIEFHYIAS